MPSTVKDHKPIKAGDTIDIKMMADGWVYHIGPVK
jgi:hypothetical protein